MIAASFVLLMTYDHRVPAWKLLYTCLLTLLVYREDKADIRDVMEACDIYISSSQLTTKARVVTVYR